MDGAVWAEASDDNEEDEETGAQGELDETFASRRLRRWLRGMFGGVRPPAGDSPAGGPEQS